MVVTELAEVSVAYFLGELAAMAIFPVVGLILLVIGLRQQSRARRLPPDRPPPTPNPSDLSDPSDPPPYPPSTPAPPQHDPGVDAPRHPRWSTALIAVGSLLLIFGLLQIGRSATHVDWQNRGTATSPDVGQCVAADSFRERSKTPKVQDCSKPDSILEVVAKGGPSSTCPDGKTSDSDYAFFRDGSTTLCFVLNFVQGGCYTATRDAQGPTFAPADCDDPVQGFKVANRIDGSSDTGSCPAGTREIAYQSPARLYCLQPLKN